MFRKQAVWWLLVPMALSQTAKGETTEAAEAAAEQEAYLDDVVVIGGLNRDRQGYNDVYDQDISTVYAGKAAIERYKGTTPSDVFKGMLGVYSGDARNSGALDPNIRGIQGQGRVPLTVDGTEQSITTWRGYNGANNRNYIDPNLIGSIQVEKGPSMTRGVNSSVGGAVVIKTLGVDDIVPAGETFGGEIKTEFSNNTVRQRLPQSLAGQDYRDVPGWNSIYNDPSLMMIPKRSGDNKLLSGQDQAYRVALGLRQDNFDLLAAYSYRNRGNYFSGKNGAHNYAGIEATNDTQNTLPKIAEAYKPGDEVPNTSSRLESYLLKGTLRLPQEQTMEFGFRRTEALYGEIMPSRVKWGLGSVVVGSDNWTLDMPQWPLSQVQQNAYHINYKWQPSDQPWFDVDATLWATRYNGNLQNGGGYPNEPYDTDYDWEPGDKPETWNPNVDGRLRNTSAANVRNNRWGLTLSNRLQLHDRLNLTVGGSLQHERIYSSDRYDKRENGIFQAQPREGRRSDNEFNFNFDWQPTDWLALSAGLRRVAYSARDDVLAKRQREGNGLRSTETLGYELNYLARETAEAYRERYDELANDAGTPLDEGWASWSQLFEENGFTADDFLSMLGGDTEYLADFNWDSNNPIPAYLGPFDLDQRLWLQQKAYWAADGNGKVSRENNPFLNGTIDLDSLDPNEIRVTNPSSTNRVTQEGKEVAVKKRGSGWAPVFSAAVSLSDNARVYARYGEALRMPSMFESTIGFSASQYEDLKPERAKNLEFAYVHDLRDAVGAQRFADVKLAWYRNNIKNVIERDRNFFLTNLDRQVVSGLELQGRYDNGRFFADLGINYTLSNKVCDEDTALLTDPYYGRVKTCVDNGFRNGYLQNMVQPKQTVNLLVGGRFLDQKLELGTRILYHQGSINTDAKNFYDLGRYSGYFNRPLSWTSVVVVDAHVNYRLNRQVAVELATSNLTNRYYLDPLSRTRMPAPGRTVRLSLTGKF